MTPPPPGPPAPERPTFTFRWAAVDGTAVAGTDYQGTSNNNPQVFHATSQVDTSTGIYANVDGNKSFTFELQTPSQLPPLEDSTPPGYEIVSAIPTRQVVIIDLDDEAKVHRVGVERVGARGTARNQSEPAVHDRAQRTADGNESVRVTTSAGAAPSADPANDYTPLTNQLVTFAPAATSATVNVVVAGDYAIEDTETLTLELSSPTNTSFGPAVAPATGTIVNDDSAPTVAITDAAGPPAQADPTNDSPIVFDVNFNRAVADFNDVSDVELVWTGAGSVTPTITQVTPSYYTVSVAGMANTMDGTLTPRIPAAVAQDDPGGRDNLASAADAVVAWDVTGPTVTIDQAPPPQTDPTVLTPILFSVEFSEPVTGFGGVGDVVLSGTAGADSYMVSGTGSSYTVSVWGMSGDGTVIADVPAGRAVDTLGNPNQVATWTDHQVTFDFDEGDQTPPTVTINQAAGQADPTSVEPVLFDVLFSEPVAGFVGTDVALSGTALPTTATVSGTGATYTVEVMGMSVTGLVIADIPAGAAEDAAGNPSAAATWTDHQVAFELDDTPPTVTINQAVGQADPTVNSPVLFTATFSEPVMGFTGTDVTLVDTTGGTLTPTVSPSANPLVYDISVAVAGATLSGPITASILAATVTDLAGNPNTASSSTDNVVLFEVPIAQPLSLAIQVPGNIVEGCRSEPERCRRHLPGTDHHGRDGSRPSPARTPRGRSTRSA